MSSLTADNSFLLGQWMFGFLAIWSAVRAAYLMDTFMGRRRDEAMLWIIISVTSIVISCTLFFINHHYQ